MTPEEIEAAILAMPVDICGPDRDAYITDNAEYYTIAYMKGGKKFRFEYLTIENAMFNAEFAAKFLQKGVLLYAVLGPYQAYIGTMTPNGYKCPS